MNNAQIKAALGNDLETARRILERVQNNADILTVDQIACDVNRSVETVLRVLLRLGEFGLVKRA